MTHLSYEVLLNFLEGRLSPEERQGAEDHLASSCEACTGRLARLRAALDAASADRTIAPPAEVLQRAIEIAKTRRDARPVRPWSRVLASLSFDSRLQLSAAAVRGSARGRQMLFSAGPLEIDLQFKAADQSHDLLGQVLGAGSGVGAFVSLETGEGRALRTSETDALGRFTFREIPPGTYNLVFDLDDQEVAVTGLEFQNDR